MRGTIIKMAKECNGCMYAFVLFQLINSASPVGLYVSLYKNILKIRPKYESVSIRKYRKTLVRTLRDHIANGLLCARTLHIIYNKTQNACNVEKDFDREREPPNEPFLDDERRAAT